LAVELFAAAVRRVVPVSSAEAAEACKVLENTYRAVNIALVNELKILYDRMGIDVWEVIEAAKTKPFGFQAFYAAVVDRVVPVSSLDAAEAVKITENVFRAVNIALVNELKMVFDRMGVDIWEVIEAAKTKPFGYMPFYPGPGLGGHCIPIDPFYLTWKSREFDMPTRFIELAGEINLAMPRYVVARLEEALDRRLGKSLGSARILIVGLAYKKNVADVRESPTFRLLELLEARGASARFHDPHVAEIPPTREFAHLAGRPSTPISAETLAAHDAVLIATDHDAVDYALIARLAPLVVDTRNALARRGIGGANVIKA
ncbi:MAG TPA: nucleotide sugar dehydrogenase, partial [Caulobacteraceae bacterium]|nr:nucleotide sugar dehydrogenase [Caulobacteraceae bacterium]